MRRVQAVVSFICSFCVVRRPQHVGQRAGAHHPPSLQYEPSSLLSPSWWSLSLSLSSRSVRAPPFRAPAGACCQSGARLNRSPPGKGRALLSGCTRQPCKLVEGRPPIMMTASQSNMMAWGSSLPSSAPSRRAEVVAAIAKTRMASRTTPLVVIDDAFICSTPDTDRQGVEPPEPLPSRCRLKSRVNAEAARASWQATESHQARCTQVLLLVKRRWGGTSGCG